MRADRLVTALLLLQVHRRLTARELATRLEVSERTVHRDMEALAMAGVPVYAERGPGGGWVLPEDFRTKTPGLTEDEIRAVFLSKPLRLLADLGLEAAADAGLVKMLAALPAARRPSAEYVRARIHVDGAGWHQADEPVPFLPPLQEAIWDEQTVRLTYRRSDDALVERTVDPLGLVAKRSTWYLVAAVDGDIRSFRVSRVLSAVATGDRFVRPAGFDLAAYWQEAAAGFLAGLPRYPATVRAAATALDRIRDSEWVVRIERESPPDAAGWVTLVVRFEVVEEACRFVLSCGPHMEVLAPEELRRLVAQRAMATAALYGR